ncbi:MAG TPA: VWA domain-containing protein [Candidatus Limnocylindrales bacterium]|nr:VWA domain-containing protein [Candidatus Limnocylindrales bacterium]
MRRLRALFDRSIARPVGALASVAFLAAALIVPAGAAAADDPGAAPAADCGLVPLDVELILDRSESMGGNSTGTPKHPRIYWERAAAQQLVADLDANGGVGGGGRHRVGVASFGNRTATVDLSISASTAAAADAAIDAIETAGNTPLQEGMAAGAADLSANARDKAFGLSVRHVVVILSDGAPNPESSRPTTAEIADFQASADLVFSVAIGLGGSGTSAVDLPLMQSLAKPGFVSDADPGGYRHVVEASDLTDLFASIFETIACPTPTPEPTAVPTPTATVAPATGTPTPTAEPTAKPTQVVEGATGTPRATLPPTDTLVSRDGSGNDGLRVALAGLGVAIGLILLVLPRTKPHPESEG